MAICFNGHGMIVVKEDKVKEFYDEFKELCEKYDNFGKVTFNDRGLIQFNNYARHYFMSDVNDFIEKHIEWIVSGRLWFGCDDEDGSVKNPFPCKVLIEIADGKVYEEAIHTRLGSFWEQEIFLMLSKKNKSEDEKEEDRLKIDEIMKKSKNNNDDEFPF